MRNILIISIILLIAGCSEETTTVDEHECPYVGVTTITDIRIFTQGFGIHEEQYMQIVFATGNWKTISCREGYTLKINQEVHLWVCQKHGMIVRVLEAKQ